MIDKNFNRQTIFAIAVILLFGTALRFYQLGHRSFWHDEVLTMLSSTGSFGDVVINPQVNTNIPPFYYAIVNLLLNFGDSESLVRFPSALFGSVSILLFFCVCRNWLGSKHGLVGAALLAISPFHLWYSQEARPYALLILLGLGSVFLFQLLKEKRNNWRVRAGFILVTAATFYCHTVALGFMAFLGAFTLLIERNKDLKYWLVNYAIIAVLMIPAILKLLTVPPNASTFESFHPLSIAYAVWAFSVGFTLGPTVSELHMPNRFDIVVSQLPSILMVMIIFCSVFLYGLWLLNKIDKSRFWAISFWFLFPLGLVVFGAIFTYHPFNVRYAILSFPPFLICLAQGILGLNRKSWRVVAITAIMGLSLLSVMNYFLDEKYQREDTRSAVNYLDATALDGDLVIVSTAYMVNDLNFYTNRNELLFEGYPVPEEPGLSVKNGEANQGVGNPFVTPNKLESDLRKIIGDRARFWLFLSRAFHSDPDGRIRAYCDDNYICEKIEQWNGTELLLYSSRDD